MVSHSFNGCDGKVPFKSFNFIFKEVNFNGQFCINEPESRLSYRNNCSNSFGNLGIFPINKLLPKFKTFKEFGKFGRDSLNLLESAWNSVKLIGSMNGIGPLNAFNVK
eukprot:NODE_353_length_8928_cov_0.455204.p10 type:complete len:108 gc:universal NODE_353_length_8928_cov_0.455204:7388-7065(-)